MQKGGLLLTIILVCKQYPIMAAEEDEPLSFFGEHLRKSVWKASQNLNPMQEENKGVRVEEKKVDDSAPWLKDAEKRQKEKQEMKNKQSSDNPRGQPPLWMIPFILLFLLFCMGSKANK